MGFIFHWWISYIVWYAMHAKQEIAYNSCWQKMHQLGGLLPCILLCSVQLFLTSQSNKMYVPQLLPCVFCATFLSALSICQASCTYSAIHVLSRAIVRWQVPALRGLQSKIQHKGKLRPMKTSMHWDQLNIFFCYNRELALADGFLTSYDQENPRNYCLQLENNLNCPLLPESEDYQLHVLRR